MNKDQLAQKIWDYHHMNHVLKRADLIMVLGSNDTRVAEYGTQLFLDGWAPCILFSGDGSRHKDDLLATDWNEPEAERFAKVARGRGIPEGAILVENKSQNTGENVRFSKALLEEKGLHPKTIIVVQKPYMERRSYATFKAQWPEPEIIVSSPNLSFEEYVNGGDIPKEAHINIMIGDLERIKTYPEKGFQTPQEIPADVWAAYEELVKAGYSKHLSQ